MTGEIEAFLKAKILPSVIWSLLTREERRKFSAENKFEIQERELRARFKNSAKKISAKRQAEFDAATTPNDSVLRSEVRDKITGKYGTCFVFFGAEYRQHICAAEIFSEAFAPNDKREGIPRTHEILAQLNGWHLGKRIVRDTAYGNQPKVYYRNDDNQPEDDCDDNIEAVNSSFRKVTKRGAFPNDFS